VPDFKTFFRHCPSCGRRFEIRLVGKKLVGSTSIEEKGEKRLIPIGGGPFLGAPIPMRVTVVQEEAPSIVEVEDFQYRYRCKHCGHEWSEVHEEVHKADQPEGYTGD
jgi:DNA-directed RNA polymerase subunit RPC12/RpoP